MQNIYKLKGTVQHYSWGGTEFIPQLLGVNNNEQKPFAEYWLGAHPNAPAIVEDQNQSLLEFIKENPEKILGEKIARQFTSLPYLFKILDVRQMLSIQVHPSKKAAEEEFEKEEGKGIPLTAPNRNYKDKNHKPELMVALSDFWLLHGFKGEEQLTALLHRIKEFNFLLPVFKTEGYKGLYERVMTLPQKEVDHILTPLMQSILPLYENGNLDKSNEDFWAARAAKTFCKNDCIDRGIFSVYFFNLLHLNKGEAIYQPARLPHAYLEGQNVEVMANSDNVLRAGLTDKHVDVAELMKHVRFEATHPAIIKASTQDIQSFDAPVKEFFLQRWNLTEATTLLPTNATIYFVYEGDGTFISGTKTITVKRGDAVLAIGSKEIHIHSQSPIMLFGVTVPE